MKEETYEGKRAKAHQSHNTALKEMKREQEKGSTSLSEKNHFLVMS